jgi:para-nitrobenzyl esterase
MRVDQLDCLVRQGFGDRSREIVEAYRCYYPEATPFEYATIAAACVRGPAFEQASRKAALRAAPAYSYIYAWRPPVLNGRSGSFHASEIAFTFDNAEICDHPSGVPQAVILSKQISDAWANFARTGNPSHIGWPRWPAYRSAPCNDVPRCAISCSQRCRTRRIEIDSVNRAVKESRETRYECAPFVTLHPD